MAEDKGKILLSGFDLDEAEKAICNNIIQNYKHKISERADFEYIKLRLRKSQKGKTYIHEIRADLKAGNQVFNTKTTDFNLFSGLAEAMEKLLNELVHKLRTSRQKK